VGWSAGVEHGLSEDAFQGGPGKGNGIIQSNRSQYAADCRKRAISGKMPTFIVARVSDWKTMFWVFRVLLKRVLAGMASLCSRVGFRNGNVVFPGRWWLYFRLSGKTTLLFRRYSGREQNQKYPGFLKVYGIEL